MKQRRGTGFISLGLVAVGLIALIVVWMRWGSAPRTGEDGRVPATATGEAPPSDVVGPFHVGISSLDVDENERAGRLFGELSTRIPTEPAVWANLAIVRLRLGDLPGAEQSLATAARLSPGNEQITLLQAIADENQGQFERAIERLRGLNNPDAAVLFRLAELLGRTGRDVDLRGQVAVFDQILQREPGNLVASFHRARLLARLEDGPLLTEAMTAFEPYRSSWAAAALQQFESAKTAVAAGNFRVAATHLAFLQNLNLATPLYQAALVPLGATSGSLGRPIRQFLKYGQPAVVVAPPDDALQFVALPNVAAPNPVDLVLALPLGTNAGASVLTVANGTLRIPGGMDLPVAGSSGAHSPASLCAVDLNGDFRQDLAWIDGGGLKLWMQEPAGGFVAFEPADDVRPAFEVAGQGVWTLDFEADGDLDLLTSPVGSAPRVLRNNGDGGFAVLNVFESFPEIRDVRWSDLDGGGDGDLVLLEAGGRVSIAWNQRSGAFTAPAAISEAPAVAITVGDVNATGENRVLVLEGTGVLREWTFERATRTWSGRELARWTEPPDLAEAWTQRQASLYVADLDNNGAVDVIASAGRASAVWLNEGSGTFRRLDTAPALFVTSIADINADGSLELAGLTTEGAVALEARGTKGYHWQTLHTRTLATVADGRLNSFGIGGRVEIRAGPLLAAMPITTPQTHFGLGVQTQVGVARIVWPNGVAQVEFDLRSDQSVTAVQRLKGSCPWVFTRNGGTFQFVKDFIWRSPLGMRINSQDTAGVDQTEDWILIPGKALSAQDGAYEIRITAELWETHFFDHIALRIVDHPESMAVFVDERFVPTKQPKLEVIATELPRPLAEVNDQAGRNVLKAIAEADGVYVDDFPLGRFQGIAKDHWVSFRLPDDAPIDQPLVLIGHGWIYPTDSSLNVAISQGHHDAPQGLMLEEYDPQHGWRSVSGDLGFPAGKNKTVVIPLPRESLQANRRTFRLRTNLEIYWDQLQWAVALPNAEFKTTSAETLLAEFRHRGFSKVAAPDRRKPDLPEYDTLIGPGPRWRDLEGFHTRHGDVRELLEGIDDRYVIMNAGDEFVLRYAAPVDPLPAGWTRDFVLIGDGWVKDGDFNTANSRTVHPLPSHAQREYVGTPQPLDDDPMFQQNLEDWQRFHTRYVTTDAFDQGLMRGAARGRGASR